MIKKILGWFGYAIFSQKDVEGLLARLAQQEIEVVVDYKNDVNDFNKITIFNKDYPGLAYSRTWMNGNITELIIKDALHDLAWELKPKN